MGNAKRSPGPAQMRPSWPVVHLARRARPVQVWGAEELRWQVFNKEKRVMGRFSYTKVV